jgi:DNA polymerase-1
MNSYSCYIWGKNGRGAVSRINKKSVYTLIHQRYAGWIETIPDEQIWLKETHFGVCSTVTKRFQSGDHNVPSGSELIDFRVSRFSDGVLVHYDYSQQEIRVLAKRADDKRLLEAFANGSDIHSVIASYVWKKPEKEITKAERKYSKAATFSILYGDTCTNFAIKFLNGNVRLAKHIFDELFGSFPRIKNYIDECHILALKYGYVKTSLGDPLRVIGMPPEALALSDLEKEEIRQNVYSRK